jgi:23S rRNA (pseudouridine1915-N3)-methyltransferase
VKIRLISVGERPRGWVTAGFDDYARRLPRANQLMLVEVPTGARKNASRKRVRARQAERLLKQVGQNDWVVALDGEGEGCSTHGFARKLDHWRMLGRDVAMLVGGADGLDPSCLARADEVMSLSELTFPHELVRVVLAEQIYRAWTVLSGHPYHRS